MIEEGNKVVAQLLIQWKDMPKEQSTWEDYKLVKTRFLSFSIGTRRFVAIWQSRTYAKLIER